MASPLDGFKLPSQIANSSRVSSSNFANLDINALRNNIASQAAINNYTNPNWYKDVPTLNAGLKNGYINTTQWTQRFKQLQAATPGNTIKQPSNLGIALHAANQVFIQPPKAAILDTKNTVVSQIKHLSGPTSTQTQRTAIMNNQKTAANNPEYQKAIKSLPTRNNSVEGIIQAQNMAAKGAKAPEIKSFLQKDVAAVNAQRGKALNVAANVVGLSVPGEGIIAKTAGSRLGAALGRDEATNTLVNSTKITGALNKARATNAIGKVAVDEAKTTHIPVREPVTTSIPVKDMSTKTVGKVNTASDRQYLVKSNQLTTAYNKEMDSIKNLPPITQKILQNKLDTKYSALQEKLDSNYGKTNISFNGRSTSTATKLPPSAMGEPAAFTPRTAPIKVESVKSGTPTAKPPKPLSVSARDSTGLKPSGSAIRTQAAAIEKGMKEEEALSGATFRGVSHKEQAVKAAQLVNEDPEKAMDIAMGRTRGDNVSHEAAVYHAVKNAEIERAMKTGDWSTVQDLANSGRHTAVSEHAQALGAEGYNTNPHDPVAIMNDLAQTRAKALGKNPTTTITKEAKTVETAVKAATPKITKMDWHQFVESIKC